MDSNTAKTSVSESVKTRPKLKAYLDFMPLVVGYVLTAALFYNLGKFAVRQNPPDIKIEEPALDLSRIYDNLAGQKGQVAGTSQTGANCAGKIKGNISSSGKIYHVPGGAFYQRTVPEQCFESTEDAERAGFRRAKK